MRAYIGGEVSEFVATSAARMQQGLGLGFRFGGLACGKGLGGSGSTILDAHRPVLLDIHTACMRSLSIVRWLRKAFEP